MAVGREKKWIHVRDMPEDGQNLMTEKRWMVKAE